MITKQNEITRVFFFFFIKVAMYLDFLKNHLNGFFFFFQVGHFLYSINSTICIHLDHRQVADIVVNSDGLMRIVAMEFAEDLFV